MNIKKTFLIFYILTLVISGCATVEKGAGFEDVENVVKERVGSKVHWDQGKSEDKLVESELKEILKKEISPNDAVQIALLNNRNLQATFEELNIAQADLVQAGLLRNPVFDAEMRFHKGGAFGLEVAILQNFIDVLFISLRKKVAEAAFEEAKIRVIESVIDLAAEVRGSFYTYQAAVQTLQMRKKVLEATEGSYSIAKKLRLAGNTTELDLSNERALYEESKISVRIADVEVLKGREKLNTLMGLWGLNTNWKAEPQLLEPSKDDVPLKGLEKAALTKSLELEASKWELKRLAASFGVVLPFGIFSDFELGVSGERESESGEWGIGPALALPIPIFNQGQPLIASAEAALKSASERYGGTAVAIRSQVRTLHAALTASKEEVIYYKKVILPLKEKIVNESQLQYNAMQIGAFQLLQAKKEQINSGLAYILALKKYWLTKTELEKLLSGKMSTMEMESDVQVENTKENKGGH